MNSWLSVMPLPAVSPYSFPYRTQNPETGATVEIRNTDDLWEIVESFQNNRFIYAQLICDIRNLLDRKSQQDLERYFYAKEWGVSPYRGSYDDHPAVWIDKVKIISQAIQEAQTVKAKRNG